MAEYLKRLATAPPSSCATGALHYAAPRPRSLVPLHTATSIPDVHADIQGAALDGETSWAVEQGARSVTSCFSSPASEVCRAARHLAQSMFAAMSEVVRDVATQVDSVDINAGVGEVTPYFSTIAGKERPVVRCLDRVPAVALLLLHPPPTKPLLSR
ncbi:hypothetical protein ACH5RR_006590 [Cinchona calisaya]|uniref:Uncharacterized protein n=1 Tax=Cinchona calisaya TaxID=153742 RepID=A0ABD3APD9_9GENT